ncbi:putative acyl-activating enzyme 5 peroxisomal, partial [Dissostichus eleginoides]
LAPWNNTNVRVLRNISRPSSAGIPANPCVSAIPPAPVHMFSLFPPSVACFVSVRPQAVGQ